MYAKIKKKLEYRKKLGRMATLKYKVSDDMKIERFGRENPSENCIAGIFLARSFESVSS